ncbi:MAG: hypothetical protein KDB14_18870 [Planctomycetales bacterium]|nr:hypothetical protein [Planctomycetales bacterium]
MARTLPLVLLVFIATITRSDSLFGQRPRTLGFTPAHEKLLDDARARLQARLRSDGISSEGSEGDVVGAGVIGSRVKQVAYQTEPYFEEIEPMAPMEVHGEGFEGGCVGSCGGCAPCGDHCGPLGGPIGHCGPGGCGFNSCDCGECLPCCFPRLFDCRTFEVFWGTQGFTGPVNQGGTGSFGFHEGVNFSSRIPNLFCGECGFQVGVRGVHSNFSGSNLTDDSRNQVFVTAGAFRRVDWGLQTGLVVDYLRENWYLDADLLQLRGEASWGLHCEGELGFLFRVGLNDQTVAINPNLQQATITPTDVYALFYRHRFLPCGQGEGRIYAGFSGQSDGLLGADFRMPLTHSLGLEGGFTYLTPDEPTNQGGTQNESWNIFLGLVWQPGCPQSDARNYYRPLFRVADNGSFLVDLQ